MNGGGLSDPLSDAVDAIEERVCEQLTVAHEPWARVKWAESEIWERVMHATAGIDEYVFAECTRKRSP